VPSYKKKKGETFGQIQTQTHIQGECHVKMKQKCYDISKNQGIPKIARKPPESRKEVWTGYSLLGRNQPCC
jgi:hypothetical protein